MELFTEDEQERVVNAIQQAENRTSGEIRLAVEKRCKGEVLDRAVTYFTRLDMHRTALRNGVLIYLATEDHQFAIIGDVGINGKVPPNFWEETKELMVTHFKRGEMIEGLIAGIVQAGDQLRQFFPRQDDDINELPDDITFGDG